MWKIIVTICVMCLLFAEKVYANPYLEKPLWELEGYEENSLIFSKSNKFVENSLNSLPDSQHFESLNFILDSERFSHFIFSENQFLFFEKFVPSGILFSSPPYLFINPGLDYLFYEFIKFFPIFIKYSNLYTFPIIILPVFIFIIFISIIRLWRLFLFQHSPPFTNYSGEPQC